MPQRLKQGARVGNGGKYRIDRQLGEGGFGETYKAVNTHINASVALKFLDNDSFDQARNEASTAHAGLGEAVARHDAVVKVLDAERWERPFVVMEFVDGQDLSEYLEQGAPLTSSDWWQTLKPLLSGLQHLHARGLVHRDIKPANIILRYGKPQEPVIVDFGAARKQDQDLSQIIVSPLYADPEIGRSRRAEFRWDIYSLAIVSFEALFRDYFEELTDDDLSVPEAHESMRQFLASSDSRFCQAIGKGLEKMDQRPKQVIDWLAMMVQPDGEPAPPDPDPPPTPRLASVPTVAAKCRELEEKFSLPARSVQLVDARRQTIDGRTSLVSLWKSWEKYDDEEGRGLFGDDHTVSTVQETVASHLNYPKKSVRLVGPDGKPYFGATRVKTVRRHFAE